MRIQWAHEDQERGPRWWISEERIRKGLSAAARACDTPHPCSCSGCGNPRRVGWDKKDRQTRQERDNELRFREELADYKIKDELERQAQLDDWEWQLYLEDMESFAMYGAYWYATETWKEQ